jgi:hypothetical protein
MPRPAVSFFLNPADLSPDERTRTLADILAMGLLRLRTPIISREFPSPSIPKNSPKSLSNMVAVSAEKSVTVHAD